MLRSISYVLTFSGGAVFGIAFLCLLQAGKGYPKKDLREGNRKCVAAVRHYSYHDEPQI